MFWSYAPTLVNSFGYPALKSNALVSVGGWVLLITNISAGWIAYVFSYVKFNTMLISYRDRLKRRGPVVLGFLLMWWGFAVSKKSKT